MWLLSGLLCLLLLDVFKRLVLFCVHCKCLFVHVCVCDGSAAVGANGFTEKNTAGHDVSRGVKATVG